MLVVEFARDVGASNRLGALDELLVSLFAQNGFLIIQRILLDKVDLVAESRVVIIEWVLLQVKDLFHFVIWRNFIFF